MTSDDWAQPPSSKIMDFVPYNARPLFQEQMTNALHNVGSHSQSVVEWFILLRLFPALVTAPLRRGSRNGGRILLHRLELWRSHQWVALYEEVQA